MLRILESIVRCIWSVVILMLAMMFYSGYSNSERCWGKQSNCPSREGSLFSAYVWPQYRISRRPCNDSTIGIYEILQRWYLHHVTKSCVIQTVNGEAAGFHICIIFVRRSCTYLYRNKCTIHLIFLKHCIFIKIGSRCFYKGN